MATETTDVDRVAQAAPGADRIVLQVLTGMWAMRAAATAARLEIPDLLASEAQTPEDIAARVGAHPGATARLMRGLASVGLLEPAGGGRYRLTDAGQYLRSDAPGSLRQMFIAESDTVHWRSWERMLDAVKTGEPRPKPVFGVPAFEYYGQHPDEGEQFGLAMESVSRFAAQAVLEAYDFRGVGTILDVGGGNGSMTHAILAKTPETRGLVVDLPYIEASAHERTRATGVSDRCRFQPGDFFESVPKGADLHVLKFILHDWNDEESIRILENCRAAIAPDGRLLIVEMIVPEEVRPEMVHLMDLNMLVMTGGRERTANEYEGLLSAAGFRLTRVIPTASPFSLIEAKPA